MNKKLIDSIGRPWLYFGVAAAGIALVLAAILFAAGDESSNKKPLYWVAPMDPDFRRDGPGKSPMGMDLIPVYEESEQASPGVVNIAPEIQLQMGVRTATARFEQLQLTLNAYGRVAFDKSLVHLLSPRVTGWIDTLYMETEGEAVNRGQPLFSIYSPELIDVQQDFLKALNSGNAAKIRESESELVALNIDRATINQIKKDGAAQRSVIFRAPVDGVVGMLKVGEDYYVEPGNPIVAVGSLENVWAEFNIFASQASLIKPGQIIRIRSAAYPGVFWEGEVDYIFPALTQPEKSLLFRVELENPMMQLKPNMQLEGIIKLPLQTPQIIVPSDAVIRLGDQDRVVLSLGEGRFKSVAVVLGQSDGKHSEILEGLVEGDLVVTSAQFLIDSQSSKTSDFLRFTPPEESSDKRPLTWVDATIQEIDLVNRTALIEHQTIDAWNMPSMTMKFQVADDVGLKTFNRGDRVKVKIADGDPLFQVLDIKFSAQEPVK